MKHLSMDGWTPTDRARLSVFITALAFCVGLVALFVSGLRIYGVTILVIAALNVPLTVRKVRISRESRSSDHEVEDQK